MNPLIKEVKFNKDGLVPAIVQDTRDKQVLMCAFMNQKALALTLKTGLMHYYSRSRNKLWLKGEESGHVQRVKKIFVDCDADCLLFYVQQTKAACHTGFRTCFYRVAEARKGRWKVIGKPLFDPKKVYSIPKGGRAR